MVYGKIERKEKANACQTLILSYEVGELKVYKYIIVCNNLTNLIIYY